MIKTFEDCTLLIVDDTEINLEVLIEALSLHYDITVASDGPTALEVAFHQAPDLILLDIMMPDMDGYEVCERLKAHPETADIPIIF